MATATLDTQLEAVQRLYDSGLYLQAFAAGQSLGPLTQWPTPEGRVLAMRLASNLGAPRMASAIGWRAWREFPDSPWVRYFGLRNMLSRRGPWPVLKACLSLPEPADDALLQSDWLALRGEVSGLLRDFESAYRFLDRAEELAPDNPWVMIERSDVLMYEDRNAEALEAARRSLELQRWYRPGVQATAHFLHVMNRDDEAVELLREAIQNLECGSLTHQLAGLYFDCGRYAEARQCLEQLEPLYPLLEKKYAEAIAAQRSDAAYHCGDEAESIRLARQVGKGFFEKTADRMAAATPDDRRTALDVPFVRQHRVTCAPATLTAIAKYWKRPFEHLEIAEKICYDGTPAHSERAWAEQNGFVAREFTVDLPTASALIGRGVPFTFTTSEPTSSHLQAVVGYDARRQTLLLRDSNYIALGELTADKGLEHYAPTGPRGMVLVPHEELHRLDGIALADAELYDDLNRVVVELERHNRPAAAAAHDQMRASAPFHRLTLMGRRALAAYDNDMVAGAHALEQLVHQFPDSDLWLYGQWFYLRRLAPRSQRLDFLRGILQRHDCDPVFRLHLAEELIDDARTFGEAQSILRRYIRCRPLEARAYKLFGNIAWSNRQFDEAVRLYFTAACLEDKDEELASIYFIASRRVQQTDEALRFLQDRFRRFGSKSAYPARTLFTALAAVDRMTDAFGVLEEALRLRPDDGGLLLFAADSESRSGRFNRAADYLQRAENHSHPNDRLQLAAEIASYRGDLAESRDHWRELLAREPQSVDAILSIVRLTRELEGFEAAAVFLRGEVDRFPHNVRLLQATSEFLRDDAPVEAECLVRRLLEFNPVDPWARRESAILAAIQVRYDDALGEIETAIALEPTESTGFSIRASIFERLARVEEGRESYRRALELSVDNDLALEGLVRLSSRPSDRKAAFDFIYRQLVDQTTYGEGLLWYGAAAGSAFKPQTVCDQLQAALVARPDLWHAWSAVVRQLVDMNRLEDARRQADAEVERFSLIPGSWVDLALVCRMSGDADGEIAALEHALQVNPVWSVPLRRLVDAYERGGDYAKARTFIEQSLRRNPTDVVLHGHLADLQAREGHRDEALATLERAVSLDPGYDWAWNRLRELGGEIGQTDRALQAADSLTKRFPRQARSWLVWARMLDADRLDERLQALSTALELNPMSIEAYLMRSRLLCEAKRFDEAATACAPAVFGDEPPLPLQLQQGVVVDARGDRESAFRQVRTLLQANPDYWNGWNQLAAWCENDESRAAVYVEIAENMVRLEPNDAWSWRHLGDARRWNEQLDAARQAYRRALELDPVYEYCANVLFDLSVDTDDWESAEAAVDVSMQHDPTEFALARDIKRHARRDDKDAALASLKRLLTKKHATDWPSRTALEAFENRKWAGDMLACLQQALDSECFKSAAERLVDLLMHEKRWDEIERRFARANADAWNAAARHFIVALAEAKDTRRLKQFIKKHDGKLRADDRNWGAAGFGLVECKLYKWGAEWMADWQSRSGVESWMLGNLGEALENLDRFDEARETRRQAVKIDANGVEFGIRAYLAAHEWLAGNRHRARELLQEIEGANVRRDESAMAAIVRAAEAAAAPDAPAGWLCFGTRVYYRGLLKEYLDILTTPDLPALSRFYRRIFARVVAERGRPRTAKFWRFLARD